MTVVADKKADLAGPGISTYAEVAKILPEGYRPLLDRKETQLALSAVKRFIEDGLCLELNLFHVEVPLIVTRKSGVNDWVTPTITKNGEQYHGLNGDILVWNPVTRRRHELTSMGIRVTKETLKQQMALSGQNEFLKLPYHKAILNDEIPLSIGGGIGQSRTTMLLLHKAHLGEVSVTLWPKELKDICAAKNIEVLE